MTYNTNAGLAREVTERLVGAGSRAIAVELDQSRRTSVKQAVSRARKALGALTILVNNAAMAQEKRFEALTDDDWDRMLAVNLRGPFRLTTLIGTTERDL